MSTKKNASGEKSRPRYQIYYSPRLAADLDAVEDEDDARRINAAIVALATDPRPRGIEKLDDDTYRVRVGNWRIIYLVDDKRRQVVADRVKRRNERTYK